MDEPRISEIYLQTGTAIVLFDGVCNLCSASVQFIINRDQKKYFRFASIQSSIGQNILKFNGLAFPKTPESVILIEKGKVFQRSKAALKIASRLTGLWPTVYVLIIIPTPVRDMIYNYIASKRYRWFGMKNECWLPTPDFRDRFILQAENEVITGN